MRRMKTAKFQRQFLGLFDSVKSNIPAMDLVWHAGP